MLRTTAFALSLLLTSAASGADPKEKTADDDARRKGLAKAADVYDRLRAADRAKENDKVEKLLPQFIAALQEVAPRLPAVKPEEGAKAKQFQKVTLNAGKTRVDGFRFRVPAGKGNWNLTWEFVYPKSAGEMFWNIAAVEGKVEGFRNFQSKANYAEKGAELPKENRRITQQLPGGKLKSGAEYLIWFAIEGDEPVDVHVRVAVTPAR